MKHVLLKVVRSERHRDLLSLDGTDASSTRGVKSVREPITKTFKEGDDVVLLLKSDLEILLSDAGSRGISSLN